jgi:hypothetical protein
MAELVYEAIEHGMRVQAEQRACAHLAEADLPTLRLPELTGGVDVAGVYELAEALLDQGVR